MSGDFTAQEVLTVPVPPDGGDRTAGRSAHPPPSDSAVGRRRLLWVPALAAASVICGRMAPVFASKENGPARSDEDTTSPRSATGPLNWDDFLHQSVTLAESLYADDSPRGEDAYLYAIASLAVRLASVPACDLQPFPGLNPEVRFGITHRGFPFNIVQWLMAPHAVIAPHCHPNASVCTIGLEGECRMRHYEIDGAAPHYDSGSHETFRIRETRRQIIAPRDVSTLSRSRDNIHHLEAGPRGARGIDITTARGGDGTFSFVHCEPQKAAGSSVQDTFTARWTGMTP